MTADRSSKVLIHDAVVYTGVDDDPINDGAVLVGGDTIEDVGPEDELLGRHENVERVSVDQRLLIPGLINTHTHLNMSILRGLAEDLPLQDWLDETYQFRQDYLDERTQKLGVRLSLAELIRSGVTTVADMSFYQHRYAPLVQESGIRAILYDTTMEEYLGTDRQEQILEFIEREGSDRVTRGAALHAPYSTNDQLLKWFMDTVVRGSDVPYSIHLAETLEDTTEFKEEHGQTPTEWLVEHEFLTPRLTAAHGVWLNEDELARLVENNTGVSHNPESNMKLGAGIAPVVDMLEAGLDVGIGTDSAASNNDLDVLSEMDAAGKLQKVHRQDPTVLPAEQILDMATKMGARSLGLEHQAGTIEPGKKADMVAVDWNQLHRRPVFDVASHLVYSATGSDVTDVWIGGERLLENGTLTRIDEQELFDEIDEVNHEINKQRNRK